MNIENIYICDKCREEWEFCPEDYYYEADKYPTTCPLCSMPFKQMVRDVFREDGFIGVIKRVYIRAFK